MTTWDELTQRISGWLPILRSMDTATFRAGHLFAEFQQIPDELTLAAVSNYDLPDDRQLDTQQIAALERLGWTAPLLPDFPIWHAEMPWPLSTAAAHHSAQLLVATLRDVFGAASPEHLQIEAFNATTGELIEIPGPCAATNTQTTAETAVDE